MVIGSKYVRAAEVALAACQMSIESYLYHVSVIKFSKLDLQDSVYSYVALALFKFR